MSWKAAAAAFALLHAAAALQQVAPASEPVQPSLEEPWDVDSSKLRARASQNTEITQSSEALMGVPMLEADACEAPEEIFTEGIAQRSEWKHMDPPTFPEPGKGVRRRMPAMGGVEYQLFLPKQWKNESKFPYPVIIYFHSHSERKWSLMNSQGLARLLANNQSTSFSSLQCWCINQSASFEAGKPEIYPDTQNASVNTQEVKDYTGPMADCAFAHKFEAIVIFPKVPGLTAFDRDWNGRLGPDPRPDKYHPGITRRLGPHYTTYGGSSFAEFKMKTMDIAKAVISKYNGDPDQVILTGSLEGAYGAVEMAKAYPTLFSSLILADPVQTLDMSGLDDMPVLVSSDKASAEALNDELVTRLKARDFGKSRLQGKLGPHYTTYGGTSYLRFKESPSAADPLLKSNNSSTPPAIDDHHTADLIYRNPDVWAWAAKFYSGSLKVAKDFEGWKRWGMPDKIYTHVEYNPTMPPLEGYNPTMPPIHTDQEFHPLRPMVKVSSNPPNAQSPSGR